MLSKIIPHEERGKYKCAFCGSKLSVKYFIKVKDALDGKDAVYVPCCNGRCFWAAIGGKAK